MKTRSGHPPLAEIAGICSARRVPPGCDSMSQFSSSAHADSRSRRQPVSNEETNPLQFSSPVSGRLAGGKSAPNIRCQQFRYSVEYWITHRRWSDDDCPIARRYGVSSKKLSEIDGEHRALSRARRTSARHCTGPDRSGAVLVSTSTNCRLALKSSLKNCAYLEQADENDGLH